MWQRFTENARKAVFYSQEEAQRYGESYVSTEHLLLGVLRTEDPAIAMLVAGICSEEDIEQAVRRQIPEKESISPKDMVLSPRGKRCIDLAYDEARNLNAVYIGCEHLFLGLLREGEGLAGRVLIGRGFVLEDVRAIALELESSSTEPATFRPAPAPKPTELLHIRQRRYVLDRLALILLADPTFIAYLLERSVRYGAIQASLEELMLVTPSREEFQNPPDLSSVLLKAQTLAGGAMGLHHLFVAIAQEETTFLHLIVKDMDINLESLLG